MNSQSLNYSPAQNRVAERMNHTLMESARTMIGCARLSDSYWDEAVGTAAYIRNRAPPEHSRKKCHPWYGRKADLNHLKVFGCVAYAHIQTVKEAS